VIARPSTATQIIRHTCGRDDALSDPRFAAPYLSYRPDEIAIERGLLPENRQSRPLHQALHPLPGGFDQDSSEPLH
jgi:hypothetical protein